MTTFPLLQGQTEVWHAWMADPTSVAYNLPAVVPFTKDIDLGRLAQALRKIWEQRRELHTQFIIQPEGTPRQWADNSLELPLVCRRMNERDAQSYIQCGFVRPFAILERQPLVRFEIIETEAHHYLLYDIHHLICDGLTLSRSFLGKDLPAAYAEKPLAPQAYGLYLHAEAEAAMQGSDSYQRDAQFYKERFEGVDFTSLAAQVAEPQGERFCATAETDATSIDHWCQQQGATPNLLFMAAFSLMLARLSGEEQVAFACLNHGRTDRRLTDAYGMFVRSVPILARPEEQQPVADFLVQLRRWLTGTVRHRTYPLAHLCRDLHKTSASTFAFQGIDIREQTTVGGVTTVGYQLVQGTTRNDLSCTVYLKGGHYEIRMEASEARWSRTRLQRIAHTVATCTENLMAHAEGVLADVELTPPEARAELLRLGQGEPLSYDPTQTFVSLFLRQVRLTPDALAVTDGSTALTYAELNRQSAALAQHLLAQGIRTGDHVAITAGQSTAFLVAAIATERIGAAYVPIDSEWPKSRQAEVMKDAEVKAVLNGKEAAILPSSQNGGMTEYQDDISTSSRYHEIYNGITLPTPTDLAYIIYTSGTTGKPKGVMISHRAKLNLIHSIVHLWHLTAESRISCHSSVAFDASVEDLFPVLTVGGSIHIMPEDIRRDLPKIHQFILDHHITGGCYTTHLGMMLAAQFPLPQDYLCLGGERMASIPHTQPRVLNTYGPTEFTVDATYFDCTGGQNPPNRLSVQNGKASGETSSSVPIGRPLPNLTAYVIDHHNHLLPRGETGELCLAGVQMANGYWRQSELTTRVFRHPATLPQKVYCTGDLVRWNEQGMLEYIGRKDRQIKWRGYRIEPEELERQLLTLTGIRQVAVTLKAVNGIEHLCAFFTADTPIAPHRLTEHLSRTLPPYMVPDYCCQLSEMPQTTAGKLHYQALPSPTFRDHHVPPADEDERLWCHLFEQATGTNPVGATDNFFHLGGTSILVASLLAAAERHGISLSYGDVFSFPTPRQLAAHHRCAQVPMGGMPNSSWEKCPSPLKGSVQVPLRKVPQVSTEVLKAPLSVGTLFLTGATGFLGSHLLHTFLTETTGRAYCLVRADDEQHALERLAAALHQQVGTSIPDLAHRVVPVVGDLHSLTPHSLPVPITSVIHCAADVRHFAADNAIEQTNLHGTDRIIDFCLAKQARLVHVSTLSIAPHSTNPYIHSKSVAEQHVLQATTTQGLQATILRIGNLTTTGGLEMGKGLSDALAAFRLLGVYPQSLDRLPIDLSPVKETVRTLLWLAAHESDQPILCPASSRITTLGDLLRNDTPCPQPVSDEHFQQTLTTALAQPEHHAALVPLLHYEAMSHEIPFLHPKD